MNISSLRIGLGYDSHRYGADRPLILGGVEIAHDTGLIGHSDADAVIHALIDSILGAAGMSDIGELYPDTDTRYRGIASTELLTDVMRRIASRYQILSVDMVIVCQAPRLAPYKDTIRQSLCTLTGLDTDQLNLKAKTAEQMGALGRGEGISVTVTTLLSKI